MTEITDLEIVQAMQRHGGSFVRALAEAWQVADEINRRKIRDTWSEYFGLYAVKAQQDQQVSHE